MKIKVVASKPIEEREQFGIEPLIGKEFDAVAFNFEGQVRINSDEFGGEVILNKNEYEVIQ